jgi:hypothetical protein
MNPLVKQGVQRAFGIAGGGLWLTEQLGRRVASDVFALVQRIRHARSEPKLGMDDVTLARRVETELFRAPDAPKGDVDVNVVKGVVYLHGQVRQPGQINEIDSRARKVPEVIDVEDLLHLPGSPAPTGADAPGPGQRSGTRPRPQRTGARNS